MLATYPWLQQQWQQLQTTIQQGRLGHAILLTGPEGLGIRDFANNLSNSLLCDAPDTSGQHCGMCRSCILIEAGNHPDLLFVEPEEIGKQIKVDQIRDLVDYFHLSSQFNKYKIAVIEPAESMNRSSANGLLKTLEEPPAGALLILISHQVSRLAVTIRSRCQRLNFSSTYADTTLSWLKEKLDDNDKDIKSLLNLSQGRPFHALKLHDSEQLSQQKEILQDLIHIRTGQAEPVNLAEKWKNYGINTVLTCLLDYLATSAKMLLSSHATDGNNSSINGHLQDFSNGLDLSSVMDCYDLVLRNLYAVNGPFSLNNQGLLEDVIIQVQELR